MWSASCCCPATLRTGGNAIALLLNTFVCCMITAAVSTLWYYNCTFITSFGRVVKSKLWSIRHWGGEHNSVPWFIIFVLLSLSGSLYSLFLAPSMFALISRSLLLIVVAQIRGHNGSRLFSPLPTKVYVTCLVFVSREGRVQPFPPLVDSRRLIIL